MALIDDFNTLLPEEIKTDVNARLHADILSAFNLAHPVQPIVLVQRVDEYVRAGVVRTEYEVIDRRRPTGRRVVGVFPTEAQARAEQLRRLPIGGGVYTLAAVDSDEFFHDTDYEILGNSHNYGVIYGCAVTADAANMTVDLAVGSIRHNGARVAVTAVTDAYTLVSDASNERWAALCVSSTGTAVLVSGDPAASASVEPTKPEIGDRVLAALAKLQAGQTIAANAEYLLDKRVMVDDPALGIQHYVESSALKAFWALGTAHPTPATYNNAEKIGLGVTLVETVGSGVVTPANADNAPGWNIDTGATNPASAGFAAAALKNVHDWTMIWRGILGSGTSQNVVIGANTLSSNFADANNIIAFRVSGTGTVQGVCDSAGTETARDTTFTPDGTTEFTLRIEVRGGGTIVRFFRNNVQVGADVTTNIPTTDPLYMVCGINNGVAASRTIPVVFDWYGWREVGIT